jgi:tripartite-type tricarboxylate transporter receptor subunit TctC
VGHLLGAEAAPDGYTLTLVSASLATQPWPNRAATAKPDDVAFIGQVTALPSVLLVRADSPHKTLAELVSALRAAPQSLTSGTLVGWWPPALAYALLTTQAAIKPRVVSSYYGGAELVVELSQGQPDFVVVGLADVGPSLAGGRLRAGGQRSHARAVGSAEFSRAGLERDRRLVAAGWRRRPRRQLR